MDCITSLSPRPVKLGGKVEFTQDVPMTFVAIEFMLQFVASWLSGSGLDPGQFPAQKQVGAFDSV